SGAAPGPAARPAPASTPLPAGTPAGVRRGATRRRPPLPHHASCLLPLDLSRSPRWSRKTGIIYHRLGPALFLTGRGHLAGQPSKPAGAAHGGTAEHPPDRV